MKKLYFLSNFYKHLEYCLSNYISQLQNNVGVCHCLTYFVRNKSTRYVYVHPCKRYVFTNVLRLGKLNYLFNLEMLLIIANKVEN